MQTTRGRAILGAGVVILAVVLFLVLRGGDDSSTETTTTSTAVADQTGQADESGGDQGGSGSGAQSGGSDAQEATIVIKDGEPVGGVQELTFTQGEDIRFTVDSDVADEVHFHGYDVGKDVEAGGSVSFDVPATDAGVFEVELEERVVPIAEITVNPS